MAKHCTNYKLFIINTYHILLTRQFVVSSLTQNKSHIFKRKQNIPRKMLLKIFFFIFATYLVMESSAYMYVGSVPANDGKKDDFFQIARSRNILNYVKLLLKKLLIFISLLSGHCIMFTVEDIFNIIIITKLINQNCLIYVHSLSRQVFRRELQHGARVRESISSPQGM